MNRALLVVGTLFLAGLAWLVTLSPWSILAGGSMAGASIVTRETGMVVLGLLLVGVFAFGEDLWDWL